MNNKQYQVLFLVAFFCLFIGGGVGYLIFDNGNPSNGAIKNSAVGKKPDQNEKFLPATLIEGIIYDIDNSKRAITIDVVEPQEIFGERVEILFDIERTKFVELLLEAEGPDDIRDVGRQTIDYNLLSNGDEVLVDIGDIALDAVKEKRVLSASTITIITVK